MLPADAAGEGDVDFDTRILPGLRALPLFRMPMAVEIDASHAAYLRGDFAELCDTWNRVAQPARCSLDGGFGAVYSLAPHSPRNANALTFLASLRAVLEAGKRARAALSPAVRAAIETEFPWLERRHEHVPPGWTPAFDFPREFGEFLGSGGDVARARVRWALVTAINEVQQACFSAHCAKIFRLPPLMDHAARERAMAINYFSHAAPPASHELWRQCIVVLDGLNAAVMQLIALDQPLAMVGNVVRGMVGSDEWPQFVAGLQQPQWLLPAEPR